MADWGMRYAQLRRAIRRMVRRLRGYAFDECDIERAFDRDVKPLFTDEQPPT